MAFAVGMVVDNSIVILENIYRHRQMGKPLLDAAQDGASEVWGAVVASTLTTMAVFIPVVFIQEEVGQLFGDIALALATAVGLSLIVSITVIPCLSSRLIHASEVDDNAPGMKGLWGLVRLSIRSVEWVRDTVYWITGSTRRRVAVAGGATVVSLLLTFLLLPPTEYLPSGNQNFLFGILLPPPGYSIGEVGKLRELYDNDLRSLWEVQPGTPEAVKTAGGGLREFFFVALNNLAFLGVSSNDPMRVRELMPEFQKVNAKVPGAIAFTQQFSIFQGDFGESGIDIEFSGPDLPRLIDLGREAFGRVMEAMPGAQARPVPSLDLENPEVHVVTDRRRAAELGVSNRDLGFAVRSLVYGAKASDYLDEGHEIDLVVKAEPGEEHRTHLLEQLPIAAPDGRLVTLGAVAAVAPVNGPVEILHSERQRTVRILLQPREDMALQTAMDVVRTKVLQPMYDSGSLGGLYQARLSGTADKLQQAWRALSWNFLLVLVITYLLMASLFESFLYPFVIMFSVPLAGVGGVLGLRLLHTFDPTQQLDVITMLGFVILVGTVVNNAILIVHQSLNHMREEGMAPREAIREATGNRIRPIMMTVGTSVLGMLPLVLFPGAGSEIYRGLGSVVVGGLVTSTLFTLFVVPAVFSLSLDARAALAAWMRARLRLPERSASVP
jgi:HAE1 family hydrophobic/amphiphilic exporter-1